MMIIIIIIIDNNIKCSSWTPDLELVLWDEDGNLGDVARNQRLLLQLAHLHLHVKGVRTLQGVEQEQLAGLPVRTLDAEMASPAAP